MKDVWVTLGFERVSSVSRSFWWHKYHREFIYRNEWTNYLLMHSPVYQAENIPWDYKGQRESKQWRNDAYDSSYDEI